MVSPFTTDIGHNALERKTLNNLISKAKNLGKDEAEGSNRGNRFPFPAHVRSPFTPDIGHGAL